MEPRWRVRAIAIALVYIGQQKGDRGMNLEIQKPALADRVQAWMQSGNFQDTDELIERALDALDEKSEAASPSAAPKNLVELFAPLRGQFTDEEVDTLFSRDRSIARTLDLS